jgi:uncharacterized protein
MGSTVVPLHLGASPLIPAHQDQFSIMQLLLDSGADANARDNAGSTPLHYLSFSRCEDVWVIVECLRLLIKYGVDIDAKNNVGKTPLDVALVHGHGEMMRFLSEQGATR